MQKNLANHCTQFKVAGEKVWLLPSRAMYWPRKRILFVADLHLGKSSHFRKSGIAVPGGKILREELHTLDQLLQLCNPRDVYFLGDLFHSDLNNDWYAFTSWLRLNTGVRFHLVRGNHDIIPDAEYTIGSLILHQQAVEIGPFLLVHEYLPGSKNTGYVLSGHLHPGITIKGKGRQSHLLPCFWFTERYAVLPAFGKFTGCMRIKPGKDDQIFAVLPEKIIPLSTLSPTGS